ncbi:MAG: site-2 protease family protein [Candidatus Marinimicrobia bacterium]|nr:site-2 protease family protein [Candidatus Neomarinimicrobiota bacterium]
MSTVLIYVLALVFILIVLISSHELGHYLAARSIGVRVERFYLGFNVFGLGIKKKIGHTEYGLGILPLGGYVKVAGVLDESMDSELTGEPWELQSKSTLQKVWFMSAGVLANLLLAGLVFFALSYFHGLATSSPAVGALTPDYPAEALGLQLGDKIIAVDGEAVNSWEDLTASIHVKPNQDVEITWERDDEVSRTVIKTRPTVVGILPGDEITSINGKPAATWDELRALILVDTDERIDVVWEREGEAMQTAISVDPEQAASDSPIKVVGMIGIGPQVDPLVSLLHSRVADRRDAEFGEALVSGVVLTWHWFTLTFRSLRMIVTQEAKFSELGGPILIAQLAGQSAQIGFPYLLGLLAIISVNLAFINVLPIPALDGGHIAITLIEAGLRRPLSLRTRMVIQQVGMMLLLTFIVVVFYNDIMRLVR